MGVDNPLNSAIEDLFSLDRFVSLFFNLSIFIARLNLSANASSKGFPVLIYSLNRGYSLSHFSILYLNAIEKLETLLAHCKKYLFEFAS